jgi:hypothetical protein
MSFHSVNKLSEGDIDFLDNTLSYFKNMLKDSKEENT